MRVAAVPLNDAVELTLKSDDGEPGWRFVGWTSTRTPSVGIDPSAADREREFSTIAEAVNYFRDHYGAQLPPA
jgi:hypothetical protein